LDWTSERILKLAPDASSAQAARTLLSPRKWTGLGANELALWGACQGSGSKPYQTQIDLSEPAFKCSCPSRKFPCKHSLALFLLFAEQPKLFPRSDPPDTVASWLQSRAARSAKKIETEDQASGPKDPEAQAKSAEKRLRRVQEGIEELQRWLEDIIRSGLASTVNQGAAFWETQASRMIDAQAPGLARMVRETQLPASRPGWQDAMFEQLLRTYLLLEGFHRLDSLPTDIQDDVRTLIGWTQDQKELLEQEGSKDDWIVLGQRTLLEDRLQVQRSWLRGRRSGRDALVLAFAYGNQAPFSGLIPGTCFSAEVAFFPGRIGLRAIVKARNESISTVTSIPGESISSGLARYAAAKTTHPWLRIFPLSLGQVVPANDRGKWMLVDSEGFEMPIDPARDPWKLLAVSGGQPCEMFGEWNGTALIPVSAFAEGRLIELS
jgi:hypothetical protein